MNKTSLGSAWCVPTALHLCPEITRASAKDRNLQRSKQEMGWWTRLQPSAAAFSSVSLHSGKGLLMFSWSLLAAFLMPHFRPHSSGCLQSTSLLLSCCLCICVALPGTCIYIRDACLICRLHLLLEDGTAWHDGPDLSTACHPVSMAVTFKEWSLWDRCFSTVC